jgi:putative nucleotidyltransferase with HDIG domain
VELLGALGGKNMIQWCEKADRGLAASAILFLLAFGPTPLPSQELVWPGETWAVSTPADVGIDPTAIEALVADIDAGIYGLIDHFTLIRHGRLVADHHFEQDYETIAAAYDTTNHQYNYDHPDWHPYYRDTDLHTLQSVTKSITSVALGIAVDRGLIPGVEVPAMSFFQAYEPDLTDPRRAEMSLEDLLTMRSGIEWREDTPYTDPNNSCILMEASEEWVPFVMDHPMDADPGTVWEYNSGASVLLGKIVQVATGQRIDAWAREELFEPLGIHDFYWKITPSGEVDTEGGLYLSAPDLARIGYLFLRGGMWGERRIVSEDWVRVSTAPVVPDIRPDNGRPDAGYGYQWWVPDHDGESTEVFAGNGYGGQFLLVAPAYDVVAVFNGWNIHGGASASTWRALQERILPAISRDPDEQSREQGKELVSALTSEMEDVFQEIPYMIEHTMTVHGHALDIAEDEGGDLLVIRASAILHDIGIPRAREVHGSSSGQYQETEGPPIAREILSKIGIPPEAVEHICGIVANHHSDRDPDIANTIEFKVIWDADWLVNFPGRYRENTMAEKEAAIEEIFKTREGKRLARQMFLE